MYLKVKFLIRYFIELNPRFSEEKYTFKECLREFIFRFIR